MSDAQPVPPLLRRFLLWALATPRPGTTLHFVSFGLPKVLPKGELTVAAPPCGYCCDAPCDRVSGSWIALEYHHDIRLGWTSRGVGLSGTRTCKSLRSLRNFRRQSTCMQLLALFRNPVTSAIGCCSSHSARHVLVFYWIAWHASVAPVRH